MDGQTGPGPGRDASAPHQAAPHQAAPHQAAPHRAAPHRAAIAVDAGWAPAASADDDGFVEQVVDLVNRVYADAERGLWRDGAKRTDAKEVAGAMRAGQLAVARLDGVLGGAVQVRGLDGRRAG